MIDITADRNKLEKYILRFTNDVIRSTRSAYFRFKGYIVRVSDHIGTNSSGSFSIIPVGNDNYVIHKHTSGYLKLQSYEEVKEFIKHVAEYSELMSSTPIPTWELAKNETIITDENKVNPNFIMGISKTAFTAGQLKSVEVIVEQVKQKNNIK